MTGAIIVVGVELPHIPSHPALPGADTSHPVMPLGCAEVLGRSVIDRILDAFHQSVFDRVAVVTGSSELTAEFQSYKAEGIEAVVLISPTAYAEINIADLLQSHRDTKALITRAFFGSRPMEIWVLDMSRLDVSEELVQRLSSDECSVYVVNGYVNFLDHPRDLRRLVVDSFNGSCHLRPNGHETRPGVWMSDSVDVHRGARIVAPAFLGRGARIEEQCLITRCSNVEANCHVDYGSVVEDSSILPNTYVGIGLDISHSIVHGSTLVNVERDVVLQISDQGVIRPNRVPRKEQYGRSQSALRMAGAH